MTRWLPWILLSLPLVGCSPGGKPTPNLQPLSLARTLAADPVALADFEAAERGRELRFPQDHGPHPRSRIEWWYFTGQLQTQGNAPSERLGYQLALFRFALRPSDDPGPAEGWASPQLYMSHFALSRPEAGQFIYAERLARPAAGLAGAQTRPWRVWVEDHQAAALGEEALFPLRLRARDAAFEIDLELSAGRGPLLHGEQGWSEKSQAPGSASFYVSHTRLPTRGRVRVGEHWLEVEGSSWKDQEWGSGLLGAGQAGWDWISLQLDDGHDLMLFGIRSEDRETLTVRGSLIGPDGTLRAFVDDGARMRALRDWTSPYSGRRYPVDWQIEIPALALELTVRARMDAQELRTRVVYWEGLVEAAGRHAGRPVRGAGYLEMTGY